MFIWPFYNIMHERVNCTLKYYFYWWKNANILSYRSGQFWRMVRIAVNLNIIIVWFPCYGYGYNVSGIKSNKTPRKCKLVMLICIVIYQPRFLINPLIYCHFLSTWSPDRLQNFPKLLSGYNHTSSYSITLFKWYKIKEQTNSKMSAPFNLPIGT